MGACHDETTYTTPTPDTTGYLPCKVQMRQGEMFNKRGNSILTFFFMLALIFSLFCIQVFGLNFHLMTHFPLWIPEMVRAS